MQYIVKNFNDSISDIHKKPISISSRLLDIESELGELSKEFLKATKYGTQTFEKTKDFELEFGDVLYSILSLANETQINAEKALSLVLEKYQKRLIKNNDIGNKN